MPKVAFVLEAESANAVNAFLKLIEVEAKVAAGLKGIGGEGRKAKQELSFFDKVGGDVAKTAAGFFTASAAMEGMRKIINLVGKEFEDMRRKEDEAAKAGLDFAQNFSQAIGQSFGVEGVRNLDKFASQFQNTIKNISTLSDQGAIKILTAYKAAFPGATWGQSLTAVKTLGPVVGWENAPAMAGLAGELQEQMPGKNIGDILDITTQMRTAAGGNRDVLAESMKVAIQMMASGVGGEESLGLTMAGLQVQMKPKAMGAVLGMLTDEYQKSGEFDAVTGKRKDLTDKQRIENDLVGLSPSGRLQWIMANPDKAQTMWGSTYAKVAPVFQRGRFTSAVEAIQAAQQQDVFAQTLTKAGTQRILGAVNIEAQQAVEIEKMYEGWGEGGAAGRARRMTEQTLAAMPQIGAFHRKLIMGSTEIEGRFGGDYVGTAIENMAALKQRFSNKTEISYAGGFREGMGDYQREISNPAYSPKAVEAIDKLIDRLTKLADSVSLITEKIGSVAPSGYIE
jgi:hypothetical protein